MAAADPLPLPDPAVLAATGCADLKRAQKNLELLAGGPLTREAFLGLLPHLLETLPNSPDPDMALNNLERLAAATVSRAFLFSLLAQHRKVLDLLLTVLGASQFLSDLLIRQPTLLAWLLEPGVLRRARRRDEMRADLDAMTDRLAQRERKWSALRRFTQRELLRIGLQDLVGNQDLAGVTEQLSALADVTLEKALWIAREDLTRRHGTPTVQRPDGPEAPCGFCILGMGKLGGEELNFSSDIDLLFVYEAEGETTGVEGPGGRRDGRVSNQQFFNRVAEQVIRAIGEQTAEGHVFRVDMRLRPQGTQGTLTASLHAYELAYESWGETWQRQALIKARPVAGDFAVGRAFLEMVAPFVYRKTLDYGAVAEVRAMKDRINHSLARGRRMHRHVKLGYGGIREIEFVVQAFQLVHGGKDPWVREANTLRALHRLAEQRDLGLEDYQTLARAYTFLRTLEHRLQILHQVQTHVLPENPAEITRLARRMGYRARGSGDPAALLLADYRRHTEDVRRIYDALLTEAAEAPGETPADDLALFFEAGVSGEDLEGRLAEVGFADPERAIRTFLALREGPPFAGPAGGRRRALGLLAPDLLRGLREAPDPDLAILHFERFAAAAGAPAATFTLLADRPEALTRLLRLFGSSESLSQVLIQQPDLLPFFLEADEVEVPRGRGELLQALREAVAAAPAGSGRLDALRRFKKASELRIGLSDILGKADTVEVQERLTALAEACLETALVLASEEVQVRHGLLVGAACAILGLGKLGGGELNYQSDLDVVFVYSGEAMSAGGEVGGVSAAEYFSKVADRTAKILTTITREGAAYRVDTRLRPGGTKGLLAQPVEAFAVYFARHAELWERQAYVKARPVAGDPKVGAQAMEAIRTFVFSSPLPADAAAKIAAMRRRMEEERLKRGTGARNVKLGAGGMVEIEFLTQYLQLAHGREHEAVRDPHTLRALAALRASGALGEEAHRDIEAAYRFLRKVEGRLRIQGEPGGSALPTSPAPLHRLALRLGYGGPGRGAGEQLLADFTRHTTRVRELYEATVGGA